jgi:hypothetical protein
LTATVSAGSGTTSPTGSVSFAVGQTALGAGVLSGSGGSATASLTVQGSQLASGSNLIVASYGGSATFQGSSASVTVNVTTVCNYSLSPNSVSLGAGETNGTVGVTAGSGCAWTASSNAFWLMISSGTPGSGDGTVGYSVAANLGTTVRSGTLTIAGQTFTVTQAPAPTALGFFTLTPCRVADTRAGSGFSGAFGAPSLAAQVARSFAIPTSACDVPATAQAYSLNITVVPPGPLDYLTVWPTGQSMPVVSTLNDLSGEIVANAAIVAAGTDGAISLLAGNDTDVIIDINGYFAPPTGQALAFYPATPCRVVDTRSVGGSGLTGAFGPPQMAALSTRSFPIPSSPCGIPSSAQAYSFNMTVVPPGPLEYLSTWPAGQSMPLGSTLDDTSGAVLANAAIVPAGTSGAVDVFAYNATDLIIDNNGYFAPPGSSGALNFYPLPPCRVADTRAMGGSGLTGDFGPPQLTAGSTRSFPIPTSPCDVPATAQAYSLNITVVPPGPLDYLTTWPTGNPIPGVSTLNDISGSVLANAAIVPAGSNGAIDLFVSDATDVIIDINGYFAP